MGNNEYKNQYQENSKSFLTNVKFLAGGTLVLVLPLVQEIAKDGIYSIWLFVSGEILLILSLVAVSVINPYIASEISRKYIWQIANDDALRKFGVGIQMSKSEVEKRSTENRKISKLAKLQRFAFKGGALFYLIGTIMLVIFININLL